MNSITPTALAQSHASPARAERSFWLVATAFVLTTPFTTAPTPLWTLYQDRDGFETVWLTVAFSSYVAGVIVSLLFFGHVSDWLGRKPLLITAVLLQVAAAILLLVFTELPGLIVARFVSGLGIGILSSTATAYLSGLNARAGRPPMRAAVVATAANLGGLGLGPIVGGLFAEFSPNPLFATWVLFLIVLLVATVLAFLPVETVTPDRTRPYRMQRITIAPEHRATYLASAAAGFAFFAITGLSGSLEPKFLANLGITSHLWAGIASAAVFLAATVFQIIFTRYRTRTQLTVGSTLLIAGSIGMTLGASINGWLIVFIIGAVVGGAGGGILLKGALSTAAAVAPKGHAAAATSGIFLAAFLGMGLPVIIIGTLTAAGLSLAPLLIGFSVAAIAITISAAIVLNRRTEPNA